MAQFFLFLGAYNSSSTTAPPTIKCPNNNTTTINNILLTPPSHNNSHLSHNSTPPSHNSTRPCLFPTSCLLRFQVGVRVHFRKSMKYSEDSEILHELVHAVLIFVKYHELFCVVSRNPRYPSFSFLTKKFTC